MLAGGLIEWLFLKLLLKWWECLLARESDTWQMLDKCDDMLTKNYYIGPEQSGK